MEKSRYILETFNVFYFKVQYSASFESGDIVSITTQGRVHSHLDMKPGQLIDIAIRNIFRKHFA